MISKDSEKQAVENLLQKKNPFLSTVLLKMMPDGLDNIRCAKMLHF